MLLHYQDDYNVVQAISLVLYFVWQPMNVKKGADDDIEDNDSRGFR